MLLLLFVIYKEGFCQGPVQKVFDSIVNNQSFYNKIIPPFDDGSLVNVTVATPFLALLSVEENRQIVSYIARINMTWKDPRLVFNATEIGAWEVVMPPSTVWQPGVELYNCLFNKEVNEQRDQTSIEVRADGFVSQLWYFKVETICQVNVAAFPFDANWCNLGFSPGYASSDQLVITTVPEIYVSLGIPEWNLLEARSFNSTFSQFGREYSVAELSIHIKRNPEFYIFFLILPTFIITAVCISAMLLPINLEIGERINMGIAGLLSLTFMLSVIVGELPRTPGLPLMGKWVIVEMFFCTSGMLVPMLLNILEKWLCSREKTSPERNYKRTLRMTTTVIFVVFTVGNVLTSVLMFTIPPVKASRFVVCSASCLTICPLLFAHLKLMLIWIVVLPTLANSRLFLPPVVERGATDILYNDLVNDTENYNKILPPFDYEGPTLVTLSAVFVTLLSVEENRQVVSYIVRLNMTWKDPRLIFNSKIVGRYAVQLPPNSVWQPPVEFFNCLDNKEQDRQRDETPVEVRADGYVSQLWYSKIETICHIDVAAFPYDESYCNFGFSPGLASTDQIIINTSNKTEAIMGIPEWQLLEVRTFDSWFVQYDRNYSVSEITFHLKRNPQFYMYFVILPTFVVTSTCISTMLLPLDMEIGDRINLGIAGMISLTFMLSVIVGGKWVLVEMFFCCGGMAVPMLMAVLQKYYFRGGKKKTKRIVNAVSFFAFTLANILTTILMFAFPPVQQPPTSYKNL